MRPGITTWEELEQCDGNVLLIVNSAPEDRDAVALVLERLEPVARHHALHVVADPAWTPWLRDRGIADGRIHPVTDERGKPLELNYFLQNPECVL